MSQVLLGVRNLSFRIAVFVALAALLVWFLGGSFLARPEVIVHATAMVETSGEGQVEVSLIQIVHPLSSVPSERSIFQIETRRDGGAITRCPTQDILRGATNLVSVTAAAGSGEVWFAGNPSTDLAAWRIYRITAEAQCPALMLEVADRLEAERQLARIAAGMPMQTAQQATAARDSVLRAGGGG